MKKKLVALAAAAVAIVPVTVSPANAGPGAGEVVFECVASLPAFPSGAGSGTCGSGSLAGGPVVPSSAEGTIQGKTASNVPFALVAAGLNNFTATFNYQEACVAGEPPVLGTANGSATITGMTGVVGTSIVNDGKLVVNFTWTRGGTAAAITITGGTLTATGLSESVSVGVGEAAFAPVIGLANTCPSGGGLKALVTGSAQVAIL